MVCWKVYSKNNCKMMYKTRFMPQSFVIIAFYLSRCIIRWAYLCLLPCIIQTSYKTCNIMQAQEGILGSKNVVQVNSVFFLIILFFFFRKQEAQRASNSIRTQDHTLSYMSERLVSLYSPLPLFLPSYRIILNWWTTTLNNTSQIAIHMYRFHTIKPSISSWHNLSGFLLV